MRSKHPFRPVVAVALALLAAGCVAPYDDGYYGGGYGGGYGAGGYGYDSGGYGGGYRYAPYSQGYTVYSYDTYPSGGYYGGYRDTYQESHRYGGSDWRDRAGDSRDWREGDRQIERRRPEFYKGDLGNRQRRDSSDWRDRQRQDAYDRGQADRGQSSFDANDRFGNRGSRGGPNAWTDPGAAGRQDRAAANERAAQRRAADVRQEQATARQRERDRRERDSVSQQQLDWQQQLPDKK